MSIRRPSFLQQRFINEAHRRFVKIVKSSQDTKEREERRKASEPEKRKRLEQSRHDRQAARK